MAEPYPSRQPRWRARLTSRYGARNLSIVSLSLVLNFLSSQAQAEEQAKPGLAADECAADGARVEDADPEPAAAFDFASKYFLGLGVDASYARDEGHGLFGGEVSWVPAMTRSLYWLGPNAWYNYEFKSRLHRAAFGLQVGRGPVALEFAPVVLANSDAIDLGGSATLSLVVPALYTRTRYSRSCCLNLKGPLRHLRNCACDRTIHAGYLVPYFRMEVGERQPDRGDRVFTTFFGIRMKYGVGF
jgi:hypothetical protein